MSDVYVYRRKTRVVDLFLGPQDGAEGFVVRGGNLWDADPLPLIAEVPLAGTTSPSLRKPDYAGPSAGGKSLGKRTRFFWDPQDYGLDDNAPLFVRAAAVVNGAEGPLGPVSVILPPLVQPGYSVGLDGFVPPALNTSEALLFCFPSRLTGNLEIRNLSGASVVYLSFGQGPSEIPVAPGDVYALAGDIFFGSRVALRVDVGAAPARVLFYTFLATQD